MRTSLSRFLDRILDSLAVLIFGPLEDVDYWADYDADDYEAEWVVAEAEELCREAAGEES